MSGVDIVLLRALADLLDHREVLGGSLRSLSDDQYAHAIRVAIGDAPDGVHRARAAEADHWQLEGQLRETRKELERTRLVLAEMTSVANRLELELAHVKLDLARERRAP